MGISKWFDGKGYYFRQEFTNKEEAHKAAKNAKKSGKFARVIPKTEYRARGTTRTIYLLYLRDK